ncbi:hypothetical protein AB0F45_27580 [Streptomyces achromogenes]|uniref:hypothetical protein n=1 Tax=Streptomyces achromogenes TaxID=67255 RepID=UPI0033D9C1EC
MSTRRPLGTGPTAPDLDRTETAGARLLPVQRVAADDDQEHVDPHARTVGRPVAGRRRPLGTRET